MATLQEIRDQVDAKLATLWNAIQNKQDNYFLAHGRYWQGLRTHTVIPADGNTVLPDIGAKTPTDQIDPWPNAIINSTFPMALQIDCYDGPLGQGYEATVFVTVLNNLYIRSAQVGPETYRVQPWFKV